MEVVNRKSWLVAVLLSFFLGGLGVDRFWDELRRHEHAARIAEDVASADASGVSGTPTFFIDGRRHHGAYDIDTLTDAVRAALNRAAARAPGENSAEPQPAAC